MTRKVWSNYLVLFATFILASADAFAWGQNELRHVTGKLVSSGGAVLVVESRGRREAVRVGRGTLVTTTGRISADALRKGQRVTVGGRIRGNDKVSDVTVTIHATPRLTFAPQARVFKGRTLQNGDGVEFSGIITRRDPLEVRSIDVFQFEVERSVPNVIGVTATDIVRVANKSFRLHDEEPTVSVTVAGTLKHAQPGDEVFANWTNLGGPFPYTVEITRKKEFNSEDFTRSGKKETKN